MVLNEVMGEYIAANPSVAEAAANLMPIDLLQPIDISNAIAWLVSDNARYVTGVTLPVDAGFNAK
jgi:NAD(P)-dependent dehydrogenase (short-subunit alcohol dehydrogenase family)